MVRIGRLLERRVERDRPDHQNQGDDNRRQKFDSQQVRPNLQLSCPARFERMNLAVMRLGQLGIALRVASMSLSVARACLRPYQV